MTNLPDFRNLPRGVDWMRQIIEASERMDRGDKQAMDLTLEKISMQRVKARDDRIYERDPGEER